MKLRILTAGLLLCFTMGFFGCAQPDGQSSSNTGSPSVSSSESRIDSSSASDTGTPDIQYDETAEKYYDYFLWRSHVSFLLEEEQQGQGFSDAQMAAYALSELIIQNMADYDSEVGFPKEEFDAVTEKYFGARLQNYNNKKSKVIPETGNITSTGWGGWGIRMVLKDLRENTDGTKNAIFYYISTGMGEGLPAPEIVKHELLSGNIEQYGPVHLAEAIFEEKQDEDGKLYLKYIDVIDLGEAQSPFTPYSESLIRQLSGTYRQPQSSSLSGVVASSVIFNNDASCEFIVNYYQGMCTTRGTYSIDNGLITITLTESDPEGFLGEKMVGNTESHIAYQHYFSIIDKNTLSIHDGTYAIQAGDVFVRVE